MRDLAGWGWQQFQFRMRGENLATVEAIQEEALTFVKGHSVAEAVRALTAREGLDPQRCSAYSDSTNDIPLLSLVGNPCAINPDKSLRSYAKAHGWRGRDYRTGRKAARIGIPVAAGARAGGGGGHGAAGGEK